ncbi:MAG: GNAT family N-acetyltransferase [Ignavibacteriales bacterium]|nr:GNAT family N-acetyltransferase [Melioribacteraceae bacterium]MCF8315126.1 GNAT family N-acetyltransferase [Ignavibacteriales bacterium]MCF8435878.1 GNAT family N-acetyltransferase [Ignavibacteriales bacterium]
MIYKISKQFLEENIDEFLALIQDVEHEYWSNENFFIELPGKWEFSFYFRMNDVIAGFIIVSEKGNCLHIHKLMVREDLRGRNVGKKLLDKLSVVAIEKFNKLSLKVYSNNLRAIHFYEKNGFSQINLFNDLIYMEKQIN